MNNTPASSESVNLQGQYAGFVSRLLAFALDQLILITAIFAANAIVLLVLSFFNITPEKISTGAAEGQRSYALLNIILIAVAITINFLFYYGYFIFFWMLVGQTPGKMVMGVRVVSTNGRPLSFFQSVRRLIGYFISMLVLFIGFLWILISDTRQGWHDKIAGTYVIYTWEAAPSFQFLRRVSQAAEKRAAAYDRKHPQSQGEG